MEPKLLKDQNSNITPWSTGAANFLDFTKNLKPWNPPISIECCLGSLENTEIVMLDTGSQWSMLGGEIIDLIRDDLGEKLGELVMITRIGKFQCDIHELEITLKAQWGKDLIVDSKVAVSEEWTGPIVLGIRGFFECLRFGIEPKESQDQQNLFYFGKVGAIL